MSALAERPSSIRAPTRWLQGIPFDEAVASVVGDRSWLLVTSPGWRRRGAVERLERRLGRASTVVDSVPPNPPAELLIDAPEGTIDFVVALGGGSVLDAAKGVAAVLPLPKRDRSRTLFAHLRDGAPWPAGVKPAAVIAVPTTTGTGSEATPWGTLWDGRRKTSIDDPRLRPRVAVLDPELASSMPRSLVLASALDALSHALEAIWNRAHTPLTDAWASQAITLLRADLEPHLATPLDLDRVARLQVAATLAGLAMNGTRTALAHSISYALTGRWQLAHGIGCGLVLAELARLVLDRRPERLAPVAAALGRAVDQVPAALDSWLAALAIGGELTRLPADAAQRAGGDLLHPARAGNFLVDVDAATAAGVLHRALARHRPAAERAPNRPAEIQA